MRQRYFIIVGNIERTRKVHDCSFISEVSVEVSRGSALI